MRDLFYFRRARQRRRRRIAAGDDLRHLVEIAGADLPLMARRFVTVLLERELRLLQLGIRRHPSVPVPPRQREHAVVERVEAGERHELEFIAHLADALLECGDLLLAQLLAPVEGRRAVIGEQFARVLRMNRFGEPARFVDVRLGRLAPDEVGVRRVRQPAGNRLIEPFLNVIKSFRRPLAGEERAVVIVDIARKQPRRVRVRSRDNDRIDAHDVGREAGGDQVAYGLLRRKQHLAAQMAAFFLGRQLILEVDGGGTRFDHRLHQLEHVQRPPEARLRVGDDRQEEVDVPFPFRMLNLVRSLQRLVDPLHDMRHAVGRVQALVGIHMPGEVRVRGDLPAAEVDRLQPRLRLLHRLVARQRAERVHVRLAPQQRPQLVGAPLRERMLDDDGAAQPYDILRRVRPRDARKARRTPALFQFFRLLFPIDHDFPLLFPHVYSFSSACSKTPLPPQR